MRYHMAKGKLRHIVISVPDKEKAAKFYEETFGFERVAQSRVATQLSETGIIEEGARSSTSAVSPARWAFAMSLPTRQAREVCSE